MNRTPPAATRFPARHLPRAAAAAALALLAAGASSDVQARCKQPVYVVIHRCNDPNDGPQTVQARGNNAIEADFSYGARTVFVDPEWVVDHDGVFPHSTYLSNWIHDVKQEVDRPGTPLSLIIMDIKDPSGPLMDLYTTVRNGLGPNINLLIDIGDWTQRAQFNQIKDAINADPHAGVALDFLDEADPQQTEANSQAFMQSLGITKYWFGDGLAAGLPTPDSVRTNMHAAMALRDSENDCGAFHGAYTWTYETESSFHEFLDMGVNGLFANSAECNGYASPATATAPEVAVAIAKAQPDKFWATPQDSPWEIPLPVVTCPGSITLECAGDGGVPATDPQIQAFLAGAVAPEQRCDDVVITNDAPDFFPNGTTVVTFSARDTGSCARTSTCTATVTVGDTIPPSIACPSDIAVDPDGPQGTVVSFAATATDICDTLVVPACPDSGDTFPVGTTTVVTCTATDSSGNSSSCTLEVKVFSPQEVVANLQQATEALPGLNKGQRTSLAAHLATLLASIGAGQHVPSCQKLDAFVAKVEQLVALGSISAADAQPILQSAAKLRATLGC